MDCDLLKATPLDQAFALDPQFYCGEQSAALDRRSVLATQWQLVTDRQHMAKANGAWSTELAGTPIWLFADGDRLSGVHNVCRHRAGPLALVGEGQSRRCVVVITGGLMRRRDSCEALPRCKRPPASTPLEFVCPKWPCRAGKA